MSAGPDVAGLLAAVAALPSTGPAQCRTLRRAATAHRAVRHEDGTVSVRRPAIVPFRAGGRHWSGFQRRDERGRFC